MRREIRRKEEKEKNRNILYIAGSLIGIAIIVFAITFVVYGNKMEQQSIIDTEKFATLIGESSNTQVISTQMGKTIQESKNEIVNNVEQETQDSKKETKKETNKETNVNKDTNIKKETNTDNTKQEVKQKELTFIKPVEGEIMKDYAKDKLLYSETLKEWTTHLGWDIKADKTTVVKASEKGKVKSIKNDPRYGLSVIIEHQDGYETLYANLLSSEFVEVGESVKQGDSIGTVGNSAIFEIIDEAHLHFEIMKNSEQIDPNQFIK